MPTLNESVAQMVPLVERGGKVSDEQEEEDERMLVASKASLVDPYSGDRNGCAIPTVYPLVASMALFIVALSTMVTVQALGVQPHTRQWNATDILSDRLLDFELALPNPTLWHEIMVYGYIGVGVLLFIGINRRRVTLYRRLFTVWGILLLFRSTTIAWTSYPDPSAGCAWGMPAPRFYFLESCGDLMFSGHTTGVLSVALVLIDAYPWFPFSGSRVAFHVLSAGAAAAAVLIIVLTRLHYTADVVVATIITSLAWGFYYLAIDHPKLKDTALVKWWERDRYSVSGCARWRGL